MNSPASNPETTCRKPARRLSPGSLDTLLASLGHRRQLNDSGELTERREQQRVRWMWSMVDQMVLASLREKPELQALIGETESAVRRQILTALQAANALLKAWRPANPAVDASPVPAPTVR